MAVLGYGRILIICTVAESEFVTNSVFPLRESFMFLGKSSVGIAPVTTSRLPSMTERLRPTPLPHRLEFPTNMRAPSLVAATGRAPTQQ